MEYVAFCPTRDNLQFKIIDVTTEMFILILSVKFQKIYIGRFSAWVDILCIAYFRRTVCFENQKHEMRESKNIETLNTSNYQEQHVGSADFSAR